METFLKSLMISTHRLYAREFSLEDEDFVHSYASDPLISRFDSWGPNTRAETKAFLLRCIDQYRSESSRQDYALIGSSSHQLIGSYSVKDIGGSSISVGYVISRDYQNMGFATECLRKIVEVTEQKSGSGRIECYVDVRNNPSIRVLEKCGFSRTKKVDLEKIIKGSSTIMLYYERLNGGGVHDCELG